ncbi:MBL fold metallo-hydrolase [Patescibacteria group bacterium]|nr:MBL fold metallo-hydrolase [Patescibacteria group bacterium]
MEIKYLGHASFLIKTKTAKVVTDPFDPEMVGLKFPKVEADIITVSHHHADHDQVDQIPLPPTGNPPLIIDLPGEFEKLGMRIFGYKSYHDDKKGEVRGEDILYKFEAEGITVLHCGDLGYVPEDSFLDSIGDIDILMVPVGGFYTIDASQAADLVKKIEPSVIIPMHFGNPLMKNKELLGKLAPIEDFTNKFGIEKPVPLPKLVYKKEEGEEEMKVVVLEI